MEPKLHLNNFNGPLELLLQLINKNKMSIYNIQITAITEQYLNSLKRLHDLNVNVFGNFIVMATKLMYIKSRMLLPKSPQTNHNPDPRSDLVHRLIIYKKYKKAARGLQRLETNRSQLHTRSVVIPSHSNHFIDLRNQLDVKALKKVFRRVIQRRVRRQPVHEDIKEWHYSVKSQSQWLIQLLHKCGSLRLKRIFSSERSLEELITNFLTVLDLIKSHSIVITKRLMIIRLIH